MMNIRQEELDEMRRDMMIEIKMRNDDDFFYDAIEDEFSERIRELHNDIGNYCRMYDRGDNVDDWSQILLEK